ncbi:MAG: hypothetical protein ABIP97_04015 [Chthoniobacterales bacterium]
MLSRKIKTAFTALSCILSGEPKELCTAVLQGHTTQLPPDVKRAVLLDFARRHHLKTFVETGTFHGDTLGYLSPHLDALYSIELADSFYEAATKRFAGSKNIHLLHGDSATRLTEVISDLSEPALLWLDAHYSAGDTARGDEDTPIVQELNLLFSNQKVKHFILIDDARDFGRDPGYPSLSYIEKVAEQNNYKYDCRFDIIRLLPKIA